MIGMTKTNVYFFFVKACSLSHFHETQQRAKSDPHERNIRARSGSRQFASKLTGVNPSTADTQTHTHTHTQTIGLYI